MAGRCPRCQKLTKARLVQCLLLLAVTAGVYCWMVSGSMNAAIESSLNISDVRARFSLFPSSVEFKYARSNHPESVAVTKVKYPGSIEVNFQKSTDVKFPTSLDVFSQTRRDLNKSNLLEQPRVHSSVTNLSAAGCFVAPTLANQLYIIVLERTFVGRLGNHMFMYASLLGIARAWHRRPVIENSRELTRTFEIQHWDSGINSTGWSNVTFDGFAIYDKARLTNLPSANLSLVGFLQSWKYFRHIEDEIRREFTFRKSIADAADATMLKLRHRYPSHVFVGVHVRRGDFLILEKSGFTVPEVSYFLKAFDLFRKIIPDPVLFLVASDDLRWCRKNLKATGVKVLKNASRAVHLAVLARCQHTVLSGGTFGWWAAWLVNGITVYFSGYPRENSSLAEGFNKGDYYPPSWIGLDN